MSQKQLLEIPVQRTPKQRGDDWIEKMVQVFTAPIIVYPGGGWEDAIPEWIKPEITMQRLLRLVKADDNLATDVEALAYIYPASLAFPLDSDWTQIYLYLATKVMGSRMAEKRVEVPADIKVDHLNSYQEGKLADLKRWIREKQNKALTERRRAEKKMAHEEQPKEPQPKVCWVQPSLFDF